MMNCKELKPFLAEEYRNLPSGRYISVLLVRTTQSEAIFRTEGSGEGCSREIVSDFNGSAVCRAIISKRKQAAVERREGRQRLRQYDLLFAQGNETLTDDNVCSLNRNNPCGLCIDCFLYGYAVGGGGAQKSRIITDDAFSLLPFDMISDKKTFNALYENQTMRDPVSGEASTSIGEDEYIVPGTHFLDIEVFKDVTEGEFVYTLGNILRSKRYGAITSRIGSMTNTPVAIVGSDTELFSTLEWVNYTSHFLEQANLEHPQPLNKVISYAKSGFDELIKDICGHHYLLNDDELKKAIADIKEIYSSPDNIAQMLKALTGSYPGNEELLS